MGLVLNNLAHQWWSSGRLNDADRGYRRAAAVFEQLAADFPREANFQESLAIAYQNIGVVLPADRTEEREGFLRKAVAIGQRLANEYPVVVRYREQLADRYGGLAYLLHQTDRPKEAEDLYGQAQEIRERLAATFPDVGRYRQSLARGSLNLADLRKQTGRPDEALPPYRRALAVLQTLVDDFPKVPAYRDDLAHVSNDLGNALRETGMSREAESHYRRALDLYRKLVAEHPGQPNYRNMLGGCLHNLAGLFRNRGLCQEAVTLFEEALTHQQAALSANGQMPRYAVFYCNHCLDLADTLMQIGATPGDPDRVRSLVSEADARSRGNSTARNILAWFLVTCHDPKYRAPDRAAALAEALVKEAPKNGAYWKTLGAARCRTGDYAGALAALEQGLARGQTTDVDLWLFLAMVRWHLDDRQAARRWYTKAIDRLDHFDLQAVTTGRLRAEAATLLGVAGGPGARGDPPPKD
jgi:tetratricopeptide (TPR) repeat protein